MRITLDLAADERLALRKLANRTGEALDATAHMALRDYLIAIGVLELLHELDEDTETQGEA